MSVQTGRGLPCKLWVNRKIFSNQSKDNLMRPSNHFPTVFFKNQFSLILCGCQRISDWCLGLFGIITFSVFFYASLFLHVDVRADYILYVPEYAGSPLIWAVSLFHMSELEGHCTTRKKNLQVECTFSKPFSDKIIPYLKLKVQCI